MQESLSGGTTNLLRMARNGCESAVAFVALALEDQTFATARYPSTSGGLIAREALDELIRHVWLDPELGQGEAVIRAVRLGDRRYGGPGASFAVAAVPLGGDGGEKPWGMVGVADPGPKAFGAPEVQLLDRISQRLVSYLNARLEVQQHVVDGMTFAAPPPPPKAPPREHKERNGHEPAPRSELWWTVDPGSPAATGTAPAFGSGTDTGQREFFDPWWAAAAAATERSEPARVETGRREHSGRSRHRRSSGGPGPSRRPPRPVGGNHGRQSRRRESSGGPGRSRRVPRPVGGRPRGRRRHRGSSGGPGRSPAPAETGRREPPWSEPASGEFGRPWAEPASGEFDQREPEEPGRGEPGWREPGRAGSGRREPAWTEAPWTEPAGPPGLAPRDAEDEMSPEPSWAEAVHGLQSPGASRFTNPDISVPLSDRGGQDANGAAASDLFLDLLGADALVAGLVTVGTLLGRTGRMLGAGAATAGTLAVVAVEVDGPDGSDEELVPRAVHELRAQLRFDDPLARIGPCAFVAVVPLVPGGSSGDVVEGRLAEALRVAAAGLDVQVRSAHEVADVRASHDADELLRSAVGKLRAG